MTMKRTTIALSAAVLAAMTAPLLAAQDGGQDSAAIVPAGDEAAAPAAQDAASTADASATAAVDAAQAAAGADLYQQRCIGCHGAIGSDMPSMAPKLAGVVGRAAGTGDGRYSEALKASGITWTEDKLDQYLSGPMAMVPGTRMAPSLAEPDQRAMVIAYLASTGTELPAGQ